ncbi:MAG TPA: hypothetical protein VFN61_09310, partial [Acidimicrobiales bacterium]|nr:hypothetical protein [Acidimicrobiales bacterium]
RLRPSLSPDGSYLAWLAPHHGLLNVWVCPLGPSAEPVDLSAARAVTSETERAVHLGGRAEVE